MDQKAILEEEKKLDIDFFKKIGKIWSLFKIILKKMKIFKWLLGWWKIKRGVCPLCNRFFYYDGWNCYSGFGPCVGCKNNSCPNHHLTGKPRKYS
jgi:hypothetical protein